MAQKNTHIHIHTACAEQVGMCVPAQINIWLTLPSGYYLAEISEREVGGSRWFLVSPLLAFFSVAAVAQVSLAVTQNLSDSRELSVRVPLPDSWPKCVKAPSFKSMR